MAAIERAVLFGQIGGIVATRSVFTASVEYESPETREDVWTEYLEAFWGNLTPYIAAIWSSDHVEVATMDVGGWLPVDSFPLTLAGTSEGQALANAVAGVLIGKCLGVRHFGRKFISPLSELSNTGNLMDGVLVAAMGAALVDYIAPLTTAGGSVLTPGVVDKDDNFHNFIGGSVSSFLGSIRKRKPGIGI